jgi:hypothetical protein
MSAIPGYNNVFIIEHIDPNVRFEMQGQPVKVGEPMLIRHCASQHFVGSDD